MVYLSVLSMLILFSLLDELSGNTSKNKSNILYFIASLTLTTMLCFRFGQGSDYTAYMAMYNETSKFGSISSLFTSHMHGQKGYHLICYICSKSGIPFEIFTIAWSITEMFLLCSFIYKFSSHRVLSLLLAYHTLYLTYIFSAFRQGFVLCIFLGILFPLLIENKISKYVVGVLLCSFIHISAIVLLLPVLINKINLKNTQSIIICIAFCCLLSGLITPLTNVLLVNRLDFSERNLSAGINILALLRRVVSGVLIIYLYRNIHHSENTSKEIKQLYKIYLSGFMLYIILVGNPLLASRLTFYLESAEIILIPAAITKETKQKLAMCLFCIFMSSLMYYKNIDSYIQQGKYYDFINVFNYPYINIFNETAYVNYCNAPIQNIYLIYEDGSFLF